MTTHARKGTAVANCTSRFVEVQLAGTVGIREMFDMAGGLERCVLRVTVLATERRIDLSVADQAVGHLRQCRAGHLVGFFEAAMAGLAGVSGIEVAADVAGRLKVGLVINRRRDERRGAPHLQVQGMAELREACDGRRRYIRIFVALQAHLFVR